MVAGVVDPLVDAINDRVGTPAELPLVHRLVAVGCLQAVSLTRDPGVDLLRRVLGQASMTSARVRRSAGTT